MRRTFSPGLAALLFLCLLLPAADFTERVPPPDFPLLDAAKRGDEKRVAEILKQLETAHNTTEIDRRGRMGDTPLSAAAENGHLEICKLLVESGATVDAGKDRGARTPLIDAASQGHAGVVQYLLSKGADINARGGGVTALLAAARNDVFPFKPKGNRKKTITVLLEGGADVNVQDESWLKTGRTPLMYAVTQADAALVQLLLSKGAQQDFKDSKGQTAADLAKKDGLEYIASLLERAKAEKIEAPPPGPQSPPLFDAAHDGKYSLVKAMVKDGEDVNQRTASGSTPLMFAADGGNLDIVRYLIRQGADVNAKNGANNTALIFAAMRGHASVVNELIRRKADVNVKNFSRGDALIYAVIHKRTDVARILLRNGAAIDGVYDDGKTALIMAVQAGHTDIARLLIAHHAAVDAADKDGVTALMAAAFLGQADTVDALLKAGADARLKAKDGDTAMSKAIAAKHMAIVKKIAGRIGRDGREEALFAAARDGSQEVVKLLLTKDMDVNMKNAHGSTLLKWAAAGDAALVKYLIEKGADVNLADNEGVTPLMKAGGSFDSTAVTAVGLLLAHGANPNTAAGNGETPLILAAKRGRADMVGALMEKGAAVSAKDKAGKSALVYAMEGSYNAVAEQLKKAGANGDFKGMQWSAYVSKQKEKFVKAVDNAQEWSALWQRAFEKPAPEIDFNKYIVACVFLGHSADWLYAIAFSEPYQKNGEMIIAYRLIEMQLRLSGQFRASGQYAMRVFERKPGVRYTVAETAARRFR
jgi:ankyrin repeat protein